MTLDEALVKAFEVSSFVVSKLPNEAQRKAFLENLLVQPVQKKREIFAILKNGDKVLEKLEVDTVNSIKKSEKEVAEIARDSEKIYRSIKRKSLNI